MPQLIIAMTPESISLYWQISGVTANKEIITCKLEMTLMVSPLNELALILNQSR